MNGVRLTFALWAAVGALHANAAGSLPASAPAATTASREGAAFTVDRYTIDNGGSSSSGGAFEITGTIGQPDADPLQPSSGGVFEITGGFWPGATATAPPLDFVFANGFEGF